jgi:hypothetical protein
MTLNETERAPLDEAAIAGQLGTAKEDIADFVEGLTSRCRRWRMSSTMGPRVAKSQAPSTT